MNCSGQHLFGHGILALGLGRLQAELRAEQLSGISVGWNLTRHVNFRVR
jgi:hypothetical protein